MMHEENRYWPFPVLPPAQQTEQHRREIDFLEVSHGEGFQPYVFGSQNFGATRGERGGLIVCRGRKRREVILGTAEEKTLSAHVDEFGIAADSILIWLRGGSPPDIAELVRGHTIEMQTSARGLTPVERR